jgi:hypothetical protein
MAMTFTFTRKYCCYDDGNNDDDDKNNNNDDDNNNNNNDDDDDNDNNNMRLKYWKGTTPAYMEPATKLFNPVSSLACYL